MKKFFKKELRKPFAIVTFTILCFCIAIKLLGPIPVDIRTAQPTQNNTFEVTGTGSVTQLPNSAQIMVSVSKTSKTVIDAQNQTNATVSAILSGIQVSSASAKDVTTINYTVFPQYNYDLGQQTPTGYTVTQDMSMKISPIDQTNTILDIITANGANQIGGISFTFDESTRKKLEEKARKAAIQDAENKAQTLASEAHIFLGRIMTIKENASPTPQPIPFTATEINSNANQTLPQIPTGENTITISVTIAYQTQ